MKSFPTFLSFAHIFLILNAIAKKAKSIVTLSFPTCRNLLYAMLYFICPKTASGSIHRLPLCLIPSSESNLSRACRLYWFNRWLTSIIRFPRALKQLPCKGHPSHLCALYRALSVMYPLAVLSRFGMERVGSITGTLFFMEVVVLDKGLYPVFLHEPVIFFRSVTGVCHTDTR